MRRDCRFAEADGSDFVRFHESDFKKRPQLPRERSRHDPAGCSAAGYDDTLYGLTVRLGVHRCCPLPVQSLQKFRAQAAGLGFVHRSEIAAHMFRQMFRWLTGGAEDIIVEQRFPGTLFLVGPVPQAEQSVQQRVLGRVDIGGRSVPPVIHQDVEVAQRLDMMPPESRTKERVARLKLSHVGGRQSFGETWMPRQIGVLEIWITILS